MLALAAPRPHDCRRLPVPRLRHDQPVAAKRGLIFFGEDLHGRGRSPSCSSWASSPSCTEGCASKTPKRSPSPSGVPTKKIMASRLASLNYVRNVAAHHARLFNRKLQHAPTRPKAGQVPVLDHLRDEQTAKGVFGTYNALAVTAHLFPSIEAGTDWHRRLAALLRRFPCVAPAVAGFRRRPTGVGVPRHLASMTT